VTTLAAQCAACVAAFIAVASFLALFYVYAGYGLVLRIAAALVRDRGARAPPRDGSWPRLAVLVTAHNEERRIGARIANLLACDYPPERLEVVVASDGSTDRTDEIVEATGDPRVRLFRPVARGGKSATQNQAIATLTAEIVVFTDAETVFEPAFLRHVAAPFFDPDVGAVDGHQLIRGGGAGDLGTAQGYYWRYELAIRSLESRLRLLAVMSGPCMAVRRALLAPLPADVGEDCCVPLEVVSRGKRVVHAREAVAWDRMPDSPAGELRARARMTLRNWKGTWRYPRLLNPLRHPGYAFALWSHKLLRWLSPVFLIAGTAACVVAATASPAFATATLALAAFYGLGLVGWWAVRRGLEVPVAGTVFSFLLANAGFLAGLVRAARGTTITHYSNVGP
jgi:cellulose synthase/poly-beta-1,6-N-acetylglucosamine synthase-like glycosyltransferase